MKNWGKSPQKNSPQNKKQTHEWVLSPQYSKMTARQVYTKTYIKWKHIFIEGLRIFLRPAESPYSQEYQATSVTSGSGIATLYNPWKMTNPNLNHSTTLIRDRNVMIRRRSIDSQHGGLGSILGMLAVLISGFKTTTKTTTQRRDTNGKK